MTSNVLQDDLNTSLFELSPDHIVVALRNRTGHAHLGWRKPGHAERLRCAALLAAETFGDATLTAAERAVLYPSTKSSGLQRMHELLDQLDRDPAALVGADIMADVQAAEHLLSWIAAVQAERLARLAEPGCAGDPTALAHAAAKTDPDLDGPEPDSRHWDLAGIQLAVGQLGAALCLSAISAGYRISDAQDLVEHLPAVQAALRDGTIDPVRARILQQRTRTLRHDDRQAAAASLIPLAKRHNPGRFATLVDGMVIQLDPDAAEARHREALDRRSLRFDPSEDGMARFIATLPAHDAQLAWDLFNSIGQALKDVDPRCADHRRADAFSAIVELLAAGHTVSAQSLLDQILATTCTCTDHVPHPIGPEEPAEAEMAQAGGTSESAERVDHPRCADDTVGVDIAPADQIPTASAGLDALAAVGGSDSGRTYKKWSLPTRQGRRTHATVVVPWDIFKGLPGVVGELAGDGMITQSWATTLLEAAATVTLLVTDPSTGQPVAVGDRTYRPTQAVRDKVMTAYPTCIFTGCSKHAEDCDCDHCQAFHRLHPHLGGPTSTGNLFPVCRLHHRLKTFGGWSYQAGPDGIQVTSPLGSTTLTKYATPPTGWPPPPDGPPPPF